MAQQIDGYYLNKTGDRVSELLSRHYIVPTLNAVPTQDTLTWLDGEYEVEFRIGEFVRVFKDEEPIFYRLADIIDGKAVWNVGTGPIPTSTGGVELISLEDYNTKKENGELVDNIIYFIIVDGEPYELYIGQFLIAKKGDLANMNFPYTFPIIFNS